MPKPTTTSAPTRPHATEHPTCRKRSRSHTTTHETKKKSSTSPTSKKTGKPSSKPKSKSSSTARTRHRSDDTRHRHSAASKRRVSDKRPLAAAASMESVDSVPEPRGRAGRGRREGDDESGSGTVTEYDSEEEWTENEEHEEDRGRARKVTGYRKGEKKSTSLGRGEKEETIFIKGKAVSVDQVKMMLKLLGKTALMDEAGEVRKEGGGKGLGVALEGVEGEGEGEGEELVLDLGGEEEDQEEYEDMARAYRHDLEDQLHLVTKGNMDLVANYKADGVVKTVSACLQKKQGGGLLTEYKAWLEAEQKYKPEIKEHWDTMIKGLDRVTKAQAEIIGKIEGLVAERMKVVAEARKAFASKSEEHQLEIEGYQVELDKSQKKAVKAYKKFTDEDAIGKDIGMKLKDAMNAYADKLIVGGKAGARGKKRKVQEEEGSDEEDEED